MTRTAASLPVSKLEFESGWPKRLRAFVPSRVTEIRSEIG